MRIAPPRTCGGFTLMELIIVIVISAIVVTTTAGFITRPIEGYMALSRRAELVDLADMSLRRIQRDIRRALPNSIRVGSGALAIEMVNTVEGVAYRDDPPGNQAARLRFTNSDDQFNTLGHFLIQPLPVINSTALRIAIYNLGSTDAGGNPLPGVNVYATVASPGPFPPAGSHVITPAGTAISLTAPGGDEDHVQLSVPHRFALQSPGQRMYLVDGPISYLCDLTAGTLTRYWNYPIGATQPLNNTTLTGLGASSALVTQRVTACSFTYSAGTPERTAKAIVELTIEESGEKVSLLHQVHVDNMP